MKSILKGLRAAAIMLCLFMVFDLLVYHKLNLISNLLLIAVGLVFIVPLTLWEVHVAKADKSDREKAEQLKSATDAATSCIKAESTESTD